MKNPFVPIMIAIVCALYAFGFSYFCFKADAEAEVKTVLEKQEKEGIKPIDLFGWQMACVNGRIYLIDPQFHGTAEIFTRNGGRFSEKRYFPCR